MTDFQTAHLVLSARGTGEDRAAIVRSPERVILAVADGAGGIGGGAEAAELMLELIKHALPALMSDSNAWVSLLADADEQLARGRGQCAVAVAAVARNQIVGASVGDCSAWLIDDNR